MSDRVDNWIRYRGAPATGFHFRESILEAWSVDASPEGAGKFNGGAGGALVVTEMAPEYGLRFTPSAVMTRT
ncbi:MAG: hypothetical protein ACXWDH_08790, partial [Aeromicrobium sp.]